MTPYAIVQTGGRQWKVSAGTSFETNRVPAEVGSTYKLEQVLFASDGKSMQIGRPFLQGASIICEVLAHPLGPKTISYYYRRRENWRKTIGHRQPLSRLLVKSIAVPSIAAPAEEKQAQSSESKPARRIAASPKGSKQPVIRSPKRLSSRGAR